MSIYNEMGTTLYQANHKHVEKKHYKVEYI